MPSNLEIARARVAEAQTNELSYEELKNVLAKAVADGYEAQYSQDQDYDFSNMVLEVSKSLR